MLLLALSWSVALHFTLTQARRASRLLTGKHKWEHIFPSPRFPPLASCTASEFKRVLHQQFVTLNVRRDVRNWRSIVQPTLDSHGGHETFFSLFLICLISFVIYLSIFLKCIIHLLFTLVLVLFCFINTLLIRYVDCCVYICLLLLLLLLLKIVIITRLLHIIIYYKSLQRKKKKQPL